jgi:hypothetical protein
MSIKFYLLCIVLPRLHLSIIAIFKTIIKWVKKRMVYNLNVKKRMTHLKAKPTALRSCLIKETRIFNEMISLQMRDQLY